MHIFDYNLSISAAQRNFYNFLKNSNIIVKKLIEQTILCYNLEQKNEKIEGTFEIARFWILKKLQSLCEKSYDFWLTWYFLKAKKTSNISVPLHIN